MGLRLRSIRQRIFLLILVPVLSLIGLYAFATAITARGAINLSRSTTVKNATAEPVAAYLAELDAERPLAMVYLAAPTTQNLALLQEQEAKTSAVENGLRRTLTSPATSDNANGTEKRAIVVLFKAFDNLQQLRSEVTAQTVTRTTVFNGYNTVVADSFEVLNAAILGRTSTPEVIQALGFVRMGRSEEMLLQESAIVANDLAMRAFPSADRAEFSQLAGARRQFFSQTLPDLDPVYRGYYDHDISPQASAALGTMENTLMADTHSNLPPPVQPQQWQQAVEAVAGGFSKAANQSADTLTISTQQTSHDTYLELWLAGGLGLLAVILAILVSIVVGRGLISELAALRQSALELANKRLPDVVERLAAGQDVDVAAEVPELPASSDEIGQVRRAFVAVQQTAIEAAVGQARLRQGISDIFRNLARRSQSLLHRQLALLDAMERRAKEPEELADLFRIDHLTTRMRRHAESLIILSGDAPARGWRNPVPFVDVLRAAVAEVEDYTRIKVTATTKAAIAGPAVADVIHLIAELAENAVIFSPPNTPVLISGDVVGRGFAVEIEDRGLGLNEERRAELNELLINPPPFDLSGSDRLGLFVASQLAKKHHIRISLRGSPYGGTTAIVLIPLNLVVPEGSYQEGDSDSRDDQMIQLTGRHAAREEAGSFDGGSFEDSPFENRPFQTSIGEADNGHVQPGHPYPVAGTGPLPAIGPGRAANGSNVADGWIADPAADPWASGDSADDPWAPARGADEWHSDTAGNGLNGNGYATPSDGPTWAGSDSPVPSGSGWPDVDSASDLLGDEPADSDLLPRRVRQASLAPQLRDSTGYTRPAADSDLAAAAEVLDDRSPEEARDTIAAMQRGWRRGRSVFDTSARGPEARNGHGYPADDGSSDMGGYGAHGDD